MSDTETIPSEILCEIFLLLCDKPISLQVLDNSLCFGEFPWAVGQVCKRWREVFLSYPHLWSSLSLRCYCTDIVGVDCLHEISRRTLLYLERSKQVPLTITVCTTYDSGTSNSVEDFPRTTWKLLLSCSERWERADLALCHEPPLLDLLRCEMPILKSLRFKLKSYIGDSHFKSCHPFIAAPCLVEVELLGWLRGWEFPWSQLTRVEIPVASTDIIGDQKLQTVLSQLKNVEELRMCSVSVDLIRDEPECSSPPIRLPSLRLLAVSVYTHEILTWLEAPLLEDLWLKGPMRYCSITFTEELSSFIRRSLCHIRRLTLDNGERQLLPNVMKLVSSVEVFCIKTTAIGRGSFLAKHITQINDGVYLPNLRKLKVTCLRGLDDGGKIMTAMSDLLETRNEESRRLVSVRRVDKPRSRRIRMFMSFK